MIQLKIIAATLLMITFIASAVASSSFTGTVVETQSAASYTYIRLAEQEHWIAADSVQVDIGDRVVVEGGNWMGEFYSPRLEKTFENIFFANRVTVISAASTSDAVADPQSAVARHHGSQTQPEGEIAAVDVEPLEGGVTIHELLNRSDQLGGETVSLRARVVKATPNVMGKNWITLADASGNQTLMTTSAILPSVGTTTIVRGVVATQVDLGSGYVYPVLLQETEFDKP